MGNPGETVPYLLNMMTCALPGHEASPPRDSTTAATHTTPRVGRNTHYPCGRGKKFKNAMDAKLPRSETAPLRVQFSLLRRVSPLTQEPSARCAGE